MVPLFSYFLAFYGLDALMLKWYLWDRSMKPLCVSIVASSLGIHVGKSLMSTLLDRGVTKDDINGLFHEGNLREIPRCTVHLVIVATGGTEHVIKEVAERSKLTYLLYTEGYNSLPAVVEAVAYLRKHGYEFLVEKLRDPSRTVEILYRLNRVVDAFDKLRSGRFGLIGGVSPWLIYSRVDPHLARTAGFGEIVEIPMEELYEAFEKQKVEDNLVEDIARKARHVYLDDPKREIAKALKLYKSLKYLIEKHRLVAIAIKCFDLVKDLNTTGCLALAQLNNELIPAACEGDVPLLYTMAIGTWITSKPALMANVVEVEEGAVTLAHCTSWFAGPYYLYSHFESGIGIGIRVDYPAGSKATIFRLSPELRTLRVGVGEIAEHDWKPYLCRTQVKVKIKNPRKILDESIGNHYALLLGDYSVELQVLSKLVGASVDLLE